MLESLQDLMRHATRLTHAGRLVEATQVLQRALGGATGEPRRDLAPASDVIDGCVFESDAPGAAANDPAVVPASQRSEPGPGDFIRGTHSHAGLSRDYKLYLPPGHEAARLPLVVMLHGCTQDADDFAAGTGMNRLAREQGFCVLYPVQSSDANPSRCWNWFKHNHQLRDSGEPALIADLTRSVIARHGIDARRVFVAGLSAGGAMAAIVAAAYPELYAAAGVHSGLAPGAASDLVGAMSAMRSGAPAAPTPGRRRRAGAPAVLPVPTIVFHGDEDGTVHPRNGEHLVAAALRRDHAAGQAPKARVERGVAADGRAYTKSTHHHAGHGQALAEHWVVHGAGHAWSGGDAAGSFTDAGGPDASAEMLRFFFAQPPKGSAG